MKRPLTIFGSFVLILAAVSCTMGAVITAFWFTVDSTVLFLTWTAAALLVSLVASRWRVRGLLILLVPVAVLFLLWWPEIIGGAKWGIFFITSEFSKWLFFPVVFAGASATEYEQTVFFAMSGILLSLPLAAAVCLRRSVVLTILLTVPIVFLTFVLIFNQAEIWYLIGLLAVYLTLLITGAVYPDDFDKRGLAVFPALAAAFLIMGVAYILTPPETYNREGLVQTLDYNLRTFAIRVGLMQIKSGAGWPDAYEGIWGFNTEHVEISDAGTRTISDSSLLEVTATHAGTFYLRGYSMQHFDGRNWTEKTDDSLLSEDHWARATPAFVASVYSEFFPDSAPPLAGISITRTGDVTKGVVYTPYFSFPNFWEYEPDDFEFYHVKGSIADLYAELPPGEYPFLGYSGYHEQSPQLPPGRYVNNGMGAYDEYVRRRTTYLQIRASTAEELRRIAEDAGVDVSAGREEITNQVVDYISSFGRYSLTPLIMPEDEDFTLYFLETSKQGYCIHYATAATQMLRSLGVPARFTSGFTVTVEQSDVGLPVEVTDRNAHAWVEVFYENYGWLPYEVTPPTTGTGAPDGRPYFIRDPVDLEPEFPEPDWRDPQHSTREPAPAGSPEPEPEPQALAGASGWNRFLLVVLVSAGLAVVLNLRAAIAAMVRRRRFAHKDTNIAIISVWRYISRLSRQKGWEAPPNTIEELALKARFSQHIMTELERDRVVGYAKFVADDLYKNYNILGRIWVRYILGL